MTNTKMLHEIMDWIDGEVVKPEKEREWNQQYWGWAGPSSCGTAMCVAGKAAALAGKHPTLVIRGGAGDSDYSEGYLFAKFPELDALYTYAEVSDDELTLYGGGEDVEEAAARILGIGYFEAEDLFNGGNEYEDILEYVNSILVNAGEEPRESVI